MGSLAGWFGGFCPFCDSHASSCASVNDELMCFQGDRGPKGACGGDGPKGEKVGLRQTDKKCFNGRVGGRGEKMYMNKDIVQL